MTRVQLDARRLLCPLPVIRTQERVEGMAAGDVVEVLCTDPGARHDIPAWCRVNGHQVIDIEERGDELVITVQVGEAT